jgi:hypothetical protein
LYLAEWAYIYYKRYIHKNINSNTSTNDTSITDNTSLFGSYITPSISGINNDYVGSFFYNSDLIGKGININPNTNIDNNTINNNNINNNNINNNNINNNNIHQNTNNNINRSISGINMESVVIGMNDNIYGEYIYVSGKNCTAYADYSSCIGIHCVTLSEHSFSYGKNAISYMYKSTCRGEGTVNSISAPVVMILIHILCMMVMQK